MGDGLMSNSSERKLQQALHQAGFYTQKAPSSGLGVLDTETGEHIDQADVVAIRSDPKLGQYHGHSTQVLVIEDKHVTGPICTIEDHERHQLKRIRAITGGLALFAVKWKHKQGGHEFFRIDDLQDTGKHWKLIEESSGMVIDDVIQ